MPEDGRDPSPDGHAGNLHTSTLLDSSHVHFEPIDLRQSKCFEPAAARLRLKRLGRILPHRVVAFDNPVDLVERAGPTLSQGLP